LGNSPQFLNPNAGCDSSSHFGGNSRLCRKLRRKLRRVSQRFPKQPDKVRDKVSDKGTTTRQNENCWGCESLVGPLNLNPGMGCLERRMKTTDFADRTDGQRLGGTPSSLGEGMRSPVKECHQPFLIRVIRSIRGDSIPGSWVRVSGPSIFLIG